MKYFLPLLGNGIIRNHHQTKVLYSLLGADAFQHEHGKKTFDLSPVSACLFYDGHSTSSSVTPSRAMLNNRHPEGMSTIVDWCRALECHSPWIPSAKPNAYKPLGVHAPQVHTTCTQWFCRMWRTVKFERVEGTSLKGLAFVFSSGCPFPKQMHHTNTLVHYTFIRHFLDTPIQFDNPVALEIEAEAHRHILSLPSFWSVITRQDLGNECWARIQDGYVSTMGVSWNIHLCCPEEDCWACACKNRNAKSTLWTC